MMQADHYRVGAPCPVEGWEHKFGGTQGFERGLPSSGG